MLLKFIDKRTGNLKFLTRENDQVPTTVDQEVLKDVRENGAPPTVETQVLLHTPQPTEG